MSAVAWFALGFVTCALLRIRIKRTTTIKRRHWTTVHVPDSSGQSKEATK